MDKIVPEIVISQDGSATLTHPIIGDTYHSTAGAVGESLHVYIKNGLSVVADKLQEVRILEMGFGSGLNFLLTVDYALRHGLRVDYTTVELYPIDMQVIEQLGYSRYVSQEAYAIFLAAHGTDWDVAAKLSETVSIRKICASLLDVSFVDNGVDLVYFDAFAPDSQPELWSEEVFSRIYSAMADGGVLVTYSAKGIVKQALRAVGFTVQRRQGALGKHHQLYCLKSLVSV